MGHLKVFMGLIAWSPPHRMHFYGASLAIYRKLTLSGPVTQNILVANAHSLNISKNIGHIG